jgi:hypothetical protein
MAKNAAAQEMSSDVKKEADKETAVVMPKAISTTQRRELTRVLTAQFDSTISCLRRQKSLIPPVPENPFVGYFSSDRVFDCLERVGDAKWLPKDVRAKARAIRRDIRSLKSRVGKLHAPYVEAHARTEASVDAMCDQLITERNSRVADVWVASIDPSGHEFLNDIPTPMDFRAALLAAGFTPQLPAKVAAELPPCPTKVG